MSGLFKAIQEVKPWGAVGTDVSVLGIEEELSDITRTEKEAGK